jgi:RNA polymerase sigma-70 factor (ECF subfamily)
MRKQDIQNDEALLNGFREGRESAFASLHREWYPGLYLFAAKITGDRPAAEDIVEESFLIIWERRLFFHHLAALKGFLYTTTRNAALKWLYRNDRRLKAETGSQLLASGVEDSTALEKLIRAETMQLILDELEKLPPKSRQILMMLFIEGKKAKDIARELRISINTVKAHKHQSLGVLQRKNLRKLL